MSSEPATAAGRTYRAGSSQSTRHGAASITAADLTGFLPPDARPRRGAVLMLFGEGPAGRDLLLTERAHDMRSHPGRSPSPAVPSTRARPPSTALREAREETDLDPAGVEIFGQLPELWLPPSDFAVTPVLAWWHTPAPVTVVDPAEVNAILREPIDELLDPAHRISVRHPSGYVGPGFTIGEDKDLILWGFTAGIISRLFDFVGWTRPWDESRTRDLPAYMIRQEPLDGATGDPRERA